MITSPCTGISADAIATLSRGQHRHPTEGMCLMEYVSLLAGRPFGDDPDCTHPVLAVLARAVNDATSPAARGHLLCFASALARAHRTDPGEGLRAADRCLTLVATVAPRWRRPRLRRMRCDLRRRLGRLPARGPAHPGDQLAAAEAMLEAVAVARRLPASPRDTTLAELLTRGLGQPSSLVGQPAKASVASDNHDRVADAAGSSRVGFM